MKAASLKFCTQIYKAMLKMVLKTFCGSVVTFVVVPERSDLQILHAFKPGNE